MRTEKPEPISRWRRPAPAATAARHPVVLLGVMALAATGVWAPVPTVTAATTAVQPAETLTATVHDVRLARSPVKAVGGSMVVGTTPGRMGGTASLAAARRTRAVPVSHRSLPEGSNVVGLVVRKAVRAKNDLWVADFAVCCGPGTDGRLLAITKRGTRSVAEGLADPVALASGRGHNRRKVFVVDNNAEDLFFGSLLAIRPSGSLQTIADHLPDPVSLAVLRGTRFGKVIAVGGVDFSNGAMGRIEYLRMDGSQAGTVSLGPGEVAASLAVDRRGHFGGRMFVAVSGSVFNDEDPGRLVTVTPEGGVQAFRTDKPLINPLSLTLTANGRRLLVTTRGSGPGGGSLVAIRPSGHVQTLRRGFTFDEGPSSLYPDGDVAVKHHKILVLERASGRIHVLRLAPHRRL
jgi:hypothetical protein